MGISIDISVIKYLLISQSYHIRPSFDATGFWFCQITQVFFTNDIISLELKLIYLDNHIVDFMISEQKKRRRTELRNFIFIFMNASYQTSLSIYSGILILLPIWKLCMGQSH
mgnify:CR=1 FL=1